MLCGISRLFSCPEDGLCGDQPRPDLVFTEAEGNRADTAE